ncbi:uncharacterized protein LOC142329688 [Lycorma delicatula]|uniref:uncharacterized protein LOC142329688 n=1 Tax=Lycorma delicatula TaxID=130591 RepID=UPI003F50D6CB
MPASGPVYQPTTVGYEQQNEWSRPGSYLSQTVSTGLRGPRCVQWSLLALSCFSISAGIIMVIETTVQFADTQQTSLEDENGKKKEVEDGSTTNIVVTVAGAFLIILGIILLGAYIRLVRRRKGCPCFPTKEQRLARQLDTQTTNGQIMTLNPSTDLLVAAQYGPVSEITYQPPQASEEEETRKLMASDNKECISKERASRERRSVPVDRFRNRSIHRAPLALHEEITPSLRSSFCSDYYQRSILNSDEDKLSFPNASNNSSIAGSIRSSLLESSDISLNNSVSVNIMNSYSNSNYNINNNDNLNINNDTVNDFSVSNDGYNLSVNNDNHSIVLNDKNNSDDNYSTSYLQYCTSV